MAQQLPTVVVEHKHHGKMRINAKDYNPAIHKKISDVHDPNAEPVDLTPKATEPTEPDGETEGDEEVEGGTEEVADGKKAKKGRKKL